MSPSQFVRQGLIPDHFYDNYQQALSMASYHFRELEQEGCVEVVETIPRRGAAEHVYRGKSCVLLSKEEFDELPPESRRGFSRTSLQGFIARTDGAVRSGTFEKRADRHLNWRSIHLDEDGWGELSACLGQAFKKAEGICKRAEERLRDSGETGFPVTFGILGFESPPVDLRF